MKAHKTNKNFKHSLDLLAHGRGRRTRLNTRIIKSDIKERIEKERIKDYEDTRQFIASQFLETRWLRDND